MKRETNQIEGQIKAIRKDRKALSIENTWYNSFSYIPDNFQKGDLIKLTFYENKGFLNINSIEKLKQDVENLDKSLPLRDSTTINNLVMVSKDIYISQEGKKSLKDVTTDVIASYKQIVSNISK